MGYLDTKGRIFDIQRFSVHDGPGIRTIVFLKGCPLRCQWCCNPESQSRDIETMRVAGETKIIGQDVTVAQVMATVEKDRSYYRRSGGGLTLSGGEATMQPQFAADLLQAAKMSGIGTAIMLGMSRAMGETMVVLMAAGGAAMLPQSLLDPVRPMPASIAAEMAEAPFRSDHYYALFATGIVLFLMTLAFNMIASRIAEKHRQVGSASL